MLPQFVTLISNFFNTHFGYLNLNPKNIWNAVNTVFDAASNKTRPINNSTFGLHTHKILKL